MTRLKPPIRIFRKKQSDSPVETPEPPTASASQEPSNTEPVWKERRKMVREIPEAVAEESFRESTWAMFDIDKENK